MTYKARTLFRIIEDIGTHALLLPHIQRPFVWDRPQMVRLFDSLMRGYPVQTLLFWRTKENIKARRFMEVIDLNRDLSDLYDKQRSQAGIEKVFVLDGQQRIQTLFAIFNGGVAGDAAGSTEEAYLDVSKAGTSENDDGIAFEIVFSPKPLPLPHYRIRDLISRDAPLDSTEIGNRISDALPSLPTDEHRARERRIFTNVNKIKALLREERDFWIEELDGVANSQQYEYKKVLEIFVRVNSGGQN